MRFDWLLYKRCSVPKVTLSVPLIEASPSHYFKSTATLLGRGCTGSVELTYTDYFHPIDDERQSSLHCPKQRSSTGIFLEDAIEVDSPTQVIKQMDYQAIYVSPRLFEEQIIREAHFTNLFFPRPLIHRIFKFHTGHQLTMAFQMDVLPGTTLRELLREKKSHAIPDLFQKDKTQFLSFLIQFGDILKKMADLHVVHRDIKTDNLMWDRAKKRLTVFDFGFAQYEYDTFWAMTDACSMAAPLFTAPEIFNQGFVPDVTCAVDIFQAGLVLFRLLDCHAGKPTDLYGTPLFSEQENIDSGKHKHFFYFRGLRNEESRDHQSIIEVNLQILERDSLPGLNLTAKEHQVVMQLLRGMIVMDPARRMTADKVFRLTNDLESDRLREEKEGRERIQRELADAMADTA